MSSSKHTSRRRSKSKSRSSSRARPMGLRSVECDIAERKVYKQSSDGTLRRSKQKCVSDPRTGTTIALVKKLESTIFGHVYEGREAIDDPDNKDAVRIIPRGKKVAVKVYRKEKIKKELDRIQENPYQELVIQSELSAFRNPSILNLECHMEDEKYLIAVFPFIKGGDMYSLVATRGKPLKEKHVKRLFKEMVASVQFCHDHGYVHRDISLENFLMDGAKEDHQGKPVLIDFGQAMPMSQSKRDPTKWSKIKYTGPVSKEFYRSPELQIHTKCESYDGVAADVWALGICFAILLTGFPPWERSLPSDARFNYYATKDRVTVSTLYESYGVTDQSAEAFHLMQAMLEMKPEDRLSVDEILQHPFLA